MKRDAVHREAAMKKQLRALARQLQVIRQDASAVDDEIIASLFEQIGESLQGLIDIG
jgi:hypothetical protein